ncbi:MAG: capsular biosynthesis protein [Rickettsiales bacterium]|nr:capsular biosynthesis protein [Rickettsiales bacterium]
MKDEKRKFLLLQGPMSYFFKELYLHLKNSNFEVTKICFNGGDLFLSAGIDTIKFTEKPSEFLNFLKILQLRNNFTDVVFYGDCRFYHLEAKKFFADKNVKFHIFEEGYFRPYWVTYENIGVNDCSDIPRNKEFYQNLEIYEENNHKFQKLKPTLAKKILLTYIYYVFRVFFEKTEFKNYLPHRTSLPEIEANGWFKKLLTYKITNYKARKLQKKISKSGKKFFLVALQLCSDSQIQFHSDYADMRDFISKILEDFAKNSPSDIHLVFKSHPEENGVAGLEKFVKENAKKFNLQDRVIYIDGGNMPKFLDDMQGLIAINSTAAISALHHKKPVKIMGRALYNFEGLTSQKPLAEFWHTSEKPDEELFLKFKNYVMQKTQINGSFYSKEGVDLILRNIKI